MQAFESVASVADQVFDPVLGLVGEAGLLAVAALVAIGLLAAWYAYRRYRETPGTAIQRVLAKRDSVTLLLHPNPDPDAMAAAMGLSRLAEDVDTETDIVYPGEIRHQENRAFRTVLELDADQIGGADEIGDEVVLVDHNTPRGFQGANDLDPIAVVDHHPGDGEGRKFTDVRPEYGACATLVVEYLQNRGFHFTEEDEEPFLDDTEATGLLYGILADTNHLTRGPTSAEFEASAALYPGTDPDLLDRVANPEMDAEVLDVKARAIQERQVQTPFVVSPVGELSNVDAIPQAAEELLQLEGTTAVVVTGKKDGTLHLSGRSRDDRVHMGSVLKDVVEDIPMASAGGHARMGGGQISIEHMDGLASDGVTIADLHDRLFDAMAGDF